MTIGCAAYAQFPVSVIQDHFQVSRQYIYTLRNHLESITADPSEQLRLLSQSFFKNDQVIIADDIFIEKTILSMALDGTASLEGIQRFLENVCHIHVSIGKISDVMNCAAQKAEVFDHSISLSGIHQGANDEIFQCGIPVLTGVDPVSGYAYLLECASDRSADTWTRAMEKCREQDLDLKVSISDFGKGLLCGIPKAFSGITFQGDLFHWLTELGKEVSSQENRAYALLSSYYQNLESLSGQRVHEKTFLKLIDLEKALPDAMETADLLRILYNWLRETVQPHGYPCQEVFSLCSWILDQMGTVPGISNRFRKALKKAGKHLPDVLGYLKRMESSLREYARDKGIPENIMLLLYRMRSYPEGSVQQKAADRKLRRTLGSHYGDIRREADILLDGIKRASSMVENLNGRLRRYMNLKRIIPERFLTLLKVYFNTRPYRRSRKKEREGKSPLELLTGQKHPDFYDIVLGK